MMHRIIITCLVIFLSTGLCVAQEKNIEHISINTEREELQRYFGYEDLLSSYLTLPVDISTNINERGYFVDIGFLLVILLPLLFLWNDKVRKSVFSKFLVLWFLLIQLVYVSTGFILSDSGEKILEGNYSNYTATNNSIFEDILSQFYIIGNKIIEPVNILSNKFSGSQDYITYPILSLVFILLIWYNKNLPTKNNLLKSLGYFSITFCFFWLILSSGILWYGYIGLILGVLIIIKLKPKQNKYLNHFTSGIISFWILIAIVARISYIQGMPVANENLGKYIINVPFFQRSLGIINTKVTTDNIHPGLNNITNQINNGKDTELIYTIGTSLDYFFNNNQNRIFKDNQLRMFNVVFERFRTKDKINLALKAAGFRYLIVDLNTHTLDKTPEKTLTEKFGRLLEYIYKNPQLTLIGTDRLLKGTGNQKYQFGVYGDIIQPGTYAVYKIN